ncbi:MAG: TonB-dependent receptor [Pseudomonadota bacterium]
MLSTAACLAFGSPYTVFAQDDTELSSQFTDDVIVVTTQRREQNLQDVPISLDVLGSAELDQRNIQGFADYAFALPSLTFSSGGPGLNSLFFRGIGASGAASQTATRPSVSIYLDDQPVSSYGFNLDIQVYDIERIEAAAGPQSTLYGAASSSGALRILTNQPDPSAFDAGFDIIGHSVDGGGTGYSAEGFVNIPLTDRSALRLVGWNVENAGFIDNVESTITLGPTATSGAARLGNRAGQVLNNASRVEDDFNTETKVGARAALGIDLNDSWTATLRAQAQEQETKGVFFHDPVDVDDLAVNRFFDDRFRDEFVQLGLSVEGKVGDLTLNYSGSLIDREIEYDNDYTEYAVNYNYIDYYTCSYSYVSYAYECNDDPRVFYTNDTTETIETHELRVLTNQDRRVRAIAGLFYNKQETEFLTNFITPAVSPEALVTFTPDAAADTYFVGSQDRTERDVAVFGEITVDLVPDKLLATFGYRYNSTRSVLEGIAGYQNGPVSIDTETTSEQSLYKANFSWMVSDDAMTYFTFSQGFRPGGVNRIAGATIPLEYDPDFVDNYEVGWKTSWLDNRLTFNGAAFYMVNRDFQFGRFDFSEAPLLLVTNVGDTRSIGVETDFNFDVTPRFTVSGGFLILDSELTEDAFFGGDAARMAGGEPDALEGSDVPFAPNFNATLSSRYEGNFTSEIAYYTQLDVNYNGSSFNGLTPTSVFDVVEQDAYTLVNASAGITRGRIRARLSVENLTDNRGEVTVGSTGSPNDIFIPRPRTVFLSFGYDF